MKSPSLFICVVVVASLHVAESRSNDRERAATPAADPMRGNEIGQMRDDNGLKLKLVWCPPGFFNMEKVEVDDDSVETVDLENDDDGPANVRSNRKGPTKTKLTSVKVFLSHGYWLGKYEVTQVEWRQIMATEPWKGDRWVKEGDDFPAADIDWNDALEFCKKLKESERMAGRLPDDWEYTLPTDAQWERACRARTETPFSFGDDEAQIGDYAWWGGNRRNGNAQNEQYPHRVGQKKPNPWGLHDMHGNVAEWCRDTYLGTPPGGRDPEVTAKNPLRICRGGNWQHGPENCRCGYRCGNEPDLRNNSLGFRLALSPVRQAGPLVPGAEVLDGRGK